MRDQACCTPSPRPLCMRLCVTSCRIPILETAALPSRQAAWSTLTSGSGCFCNIHGMSGKVVINNRSAGHRPLTGRIRCPGDCLRENEMIFYTEISRRRFLKDVTPMLLSKQHPAHYYKYLITVTHSNSYSQSHNSDLFPFCSSVDCAVYLTRRLVPQRVHTCKQS